MVELWKPVQNYEELYEVSNLGSVKSLERLAHTQQTEKKAHKIKERILKPGVNNQGYLTVSLSKQGKRKTFKIYRLVSEAFLGTKPKNYVTRHGAKGSQDNSVTNLSYGTYQDNERDKIRDKSSNHKFSEKEILEIRQIYREGQLNIKQLSVLYAVDHACMWKIIRYKSYKHVK